MSWIGSSGGGGGSGGGGVTHVNVIQFNASGTYTPPANLVYALVELVGGGGGAASQAANTADTAIAGGGGGAYTRAWLRAADFSGPAPVTVGAGGAAGVDGGGNGGGGGSSFLQIGINAIIGNGGAGSQPNFPGAGGPANPPVLGSGSSFPGQSGRLGFRQVDNSIIPGFGGETVLVPMQAAVGAFISTGEFAGRPGGANTGNGAGGAVRISSSGALSGTAGGSGFVIVTEFLSG